MKSNKLIVFVFVTFLFSALVITANLVAAAPSDKLVSEDITPVDDAAAPDSTDWIPDQKVSDTTQDDRYPSIATAGDGSLWVAYEHYSSASSSYVINVARSTDGGVTWTLKHTIDLSKDVYKPSIAVDPYTNNVYVVYEYEYSSTDYDIWLDRSSEGGWYRESIDSSGSNDHSPSVACEYDYGSYSAGNYVFVTWERRVSATCINLIFARSTDRGDTWSGYALTSYSAAFEANEPSMTYAGDGRVYIAFRSYDGIESLYNIGLLRSDNEGASFGSIQVILTNWYEDLRQPTIAAIPGGTTVMAAWIYTYSSTDHDIYYRYSTDSGATWTGGDSHYGSSLAITTLDEVAPHLTVDG
ncbi:MAG: sialidase family protein, partial [Candidatus Bathyarchaeia archaeon]|nr:sialidase family protein [Candidatus Bathyarchaeia archaeon]